MHKQLLFILLSLSAALNAEPEVALPTAGQVDKVAQAPAKKASAKRSMGRKRGNGFRRKLNIDLALRAAGLGLGAVATVATIGLGSSAVWHFNRKAKAERVFAELQMAERCPQGIFYTQLARRLVGGIFEYHLAEDQLGELPDYKLLREAAAQLKRFVELTPAKYRNVDAVRAVSVALDSLEAFEQLRGDVVRLEGRILTPAAANQRLEVAQREKRRIADCVRAITPVQEALCALCQDASVCAYLNDMDQDDGGTRLYAFRDYINQSADRMTQLKTEAEQAIDGAITGLQGEVRSGTTAYDVNALRGAVTTFRDNAQNLRRDLFQVLRIVLSRVAQPPAGIVPPPAAAPAYPPGFAGFARGAAIPSTRGGASGFDAAASRSESHTRRAPAVDARAPRRLPSSPASPVAAGGVRFDAAAREDEWRTASDASSAASLPRRGVRRAARAHGAPADAARAHRR